MKDDNYYLTKKEPCHKCPNSRNWRSVDHADGSSTKKAWCEFFEAILYVSVNGLYKLIRAQGEKEKHVPVERNCVGFGDSTWKER